MRVAWAYRTSANGRHSFQPRERRPELTAQASLDGSVGAELVEAEQGRADDRRGRGRPDGHRGGRLAQARVDRFQQVAVDVLEHAAAEQNLHGLVVELEAR